MSDTQNEAASLTDLVDALEQIEREEPKVSVDDILGAVGRRSFGPLLLVAGLITLVPVISGIPGVPTLMAVMVLLVAVQLLAGRKTFWLPQWLLRRSVSRKSFDKALGWLKKPAKWMDTLLGVKLGWMSGFWGIRATAVACLLVALAMPLMEFVPFSANGAGVALSLFGIGLITRDGIVLALGFLLTAATLAAALVNLL